MDDEKKYLFFNVSITNGVVNIVELGYSCSTYVCVSVSHKKLLYLMYETIYYVTETLKNKLFTFPSTSTNILFKTLLLIKKLFDS